MYDKEAIIAAIWADPKRATGMDWNWRGNSWQSRQRPDGTDGHRPDKMILRRQGSGNIWVHYNGGSFPQSQDIIDFCKYLYNTNDFVEVLERLGAAYGIAPDYSGYSQERIDAARKRQAAAPYLEFMAQYFTAALNDERGAGARAYLEKRGLQPSERMGAVSEQIIKGLIECMHSYFQFAGISIVEIKRKVEAYFTFGTDNPYRINADDYALVLPYYSGGRCAGFCFRYTGNGNPKAKYLYTQGMEKGGYCDNLDRSQPVLLVEGLIDAERCKQAGFKNVLALGGTIPTASEENPQKSQIKTLQRYGAKWLVYVPDYEHEKVKNEAGEVVGEGAVKTAATHNAIKAILPYLDTRADGKGFAGLKIADLSNKKGYKDADDYIRGFGSQAFSYVVANAIPWHLWQLKTAAEHLEAEELVSEAQRIYCSIKNPITREDLKRRITAGNYPYLEKLRQLGMNAAALTQIDRNGAASSYREKVAAASAELAEAIKNNAPASTIAEITRNLAKAQRVNNANSFAAQVSTNREELEQMVAERPDYLETSWTLYREENNPITGGTDYKPVRRISFAPAAVSIVAAPTNHGKTLFMMQTAIYLAQAGAGRRYLYISTEEDLQQLYIRALAAFIGDKWKGVSQPRAELRNFIRSKDMPLQLFSGTGRADTDIETETARYWRDVAPNLKYVYDNGADIDSLKEKITEIVEEWRAAGVEVGGVFIDYLQMIHKSGKTYSRTEEIKDVCDGLNDLAKTASIPVILAAQLNRDATRNEDYIDGVDVTNLGESAGIERIANDIYLLWQVDKIKPEKYTAARRKQRATRCFDGDGIRSDRLYIENLKARDYRTGGYCLLEYDGAAGHIKSESEY